MASADIQLIREKQRLGPDFWQESTEKALKIDPIAPTVIDRIGAGCKIDRHGNRDSGDHCRMAAAFPEVLKRDVSAEAESDQRDAGISLGRQRNHCTEISGFAVMI